MPKLYYQGHASLRFTTNEGKVIYVDPYAGEGYGVPADLILVTHEHVDHSNVDLVAKKDWTPILRSKDAHQNGEYYEFDYAGIHIIPTPAANKNHDPNLCVGYLLEMDGLRIYIAGDTDYVPYMEKLGEMAIDYAFLPIDGVFNMGPEEASRCAQIIKPKHLIPYHMKPGFLFDIRQDMRVTYPGAMLVRPGQEIDL